MAATGKSCASGTPALRRRSCTSGAAGRAPARVTSKGIGRSAWFKDPDGNPIALFETE